MAHLSNVSVLCSAQKTPLAVWSASGGVQAKPTLSFARAGLFTKTTSPKVGVLSSPSFFISDLNKITGSISGVAVKEGQYSARKIRMYDRASGQLVKELICDINGTFSLPKLTTERQFYLVALEDNPAFDAAILDKVSAIP